jgi:hypothetical protein
MSQRSAPPVTGVSIELTLIGVAAHSVADVHCR